MMGKAAKLLFFGMGIGLSRSAIPLRGEETQISNNNFSPNNNNSWYGNIAYFDNNENNLLVISSDYNRHQNLNFTYQPNSESGINLHEFVVTNGCDPSQPTWCRLVFNIFSNVGNYLCGSAVFNPATTTFFGAFGDVCGMHLIQLDNAIQVFNPSSVPTFRR